MNKTQIRTEEKHQDPGILTIIGIMCFPLIGQATSMLNPAMNVLREHFAGHNVYLFSSFPNAFAFIGNIIAGAVLGTKLRYRTMAIIASIMFLFGGFTPFFVDNYWYTFVGMNLVGLSLGLMGPVANSMIIGLFAEKRRVTLLGYVNMIGYAGGVALTMLGGVLADIDARFVFLGYLLGGIGLIAAFLLPDMELSDKNSKEKVNIRNFFRSVNKVFFLIPLIQLLMNMLNIPMLMQLSELIDIRGFGGATVAAGAISAFNFAGVIGGLFFGKIFEKTKRWILGLGFLLSVAGMFVIYTATSTVLQLTIGLCMINIAGTVIFSSFSEWLGRIVPRSYLSVAVAIAGIGGTIGSFAVAYYINFLKMVFGESILSAITISMIAYAIIGAGFLIRSPFRKEKETVEGEAA